MSAYTPGPWTVSDRGIWDISIVAGGTVCHVSNKGDWFPKDDRESISGRSQNRMLADARLIAAAPELLEALEIMVVGACAVGVPHVGERQVLQEAVNTARTAIAKATGVQP